MREVYVIYADTWDDGYGTQIDLFAVVDDVDELESTKDELRKLGYEPYHETMTLGEISQRYLGGYIE